jgi:Retrotransposon gag protein
VSNGTANPNDKHVWNTFIEEFTEVFTDTTRREQATLDLINIQMKGENLDMYISTFYHLRERAGWEPDAQGTILMFRRGLKCPLATAIVEWTHPRPQTLQGWYQAARAHHVTIFCLLYDMTKGLACWQILTIYPWWYNDKAWHSSIAWLIVM